MTYSVEQLETWTEWSRLFESTSTFSILDIEVGSQVPLTLVSPRGFKRTLKTRTGALQEFLVCILPCIDLGELQFRCLVTHVLMLKDRPQTPPGTLGSYLEGIAESLKQTGVVHVNVDRTGPASWSLSRFEPDETLAIPDAAIAWYQEWVLENGNQIDKLVREHLASKGAR